MGVVYEGWDPRLDRRVAVKTLRADMATNEEARRLFLREARAVAAISHPHVTQIYYIGDEGDTVFFAMEYLDGPSLRELLQQREHVEPAEAIDWIRQAALGLQAADELGIVHRDIKPSNLVLTANGKLKVTDFGLAKQTWQEAGPSNSTTFIATADYVAPERAAGDPADRRSDIYSLGCTFYELVTGRPPFQGATPVAVISKHLREQVAAPINVRPELSYPVSSLIMQMLAKQPEARPATYDALIRQLDRLSAGSFASAPAMPLTATTFEPESRSGTSPWVWGAAAFALIAVGLIGAWSQVNKAESRPAATVALDPFAGDFGPPAGDGTGGSPLAVPTAVPESGREPASKSGTRRPAVAPRTVRQQPAPALRSQLVVIDSDYHFESEGVLRVSGRVRNEGDGRATASKIKIIVRDTFDEPAATATIPLDPGTLGPGDEASFDVTIPGVVEAERLQLELRWLS